MRQIRRWMTMAALLALAGAPLRAQQGGEPMSSRGPQFLVTMRGTARPAVADVGRTAVLMRRVSVDLRGMTLEAALTTIARVSGLNLIYGDGVIRLDERVHLKADEITVAAVLTAVLLDTGVDVLLSPGNRATLVKRTGSVARETGIVLGRITDAKTGDRLVGAEIVLDGTRWRTTSGENGYYRLSDVEAGRYTLTVRRVGYARQARAVDVESGRELTADVALQPVVTQLNELVSTVTGDQRRLEVGHVVGVINADSLVKEAPISTLSELLTSRVPGVQVFQKQGTVGGTVRVQIRGANSLLLNNEPIVVVDGVRYVTAEQTTLWGPGPWSAERTSPLNDINPNDIEAIEIVKGPSAATLYGTDAANGVIIVTTKRGQSGPPRWNLHAKSIRTNPPSYHYPDVYWGWRSIGGVPSMTRRCPLISVANGSCTQDSVTVLPNPMNDPRFSVFGPATTWSTGADVSGGKQDLRYYFSGDLEDATGIARMPPYAIDLLTQSGGTLREDQLRPNGLDKLNLRAGATAMFGERAELQVSSGYIHSKTRSLNENNPFSNGMLTTQPGSPYGSQDGSPPQEGFSQSSSERTDRFVGAARGEWRPTAWLKTGAKVGLDFGTRNRLSLARRGATTTTWYTSGEIGEDRVRQMATTVDLDATITARRGRLTFRTSGGVQYQRNLLDGLWSHGDDLPPGGTSIGEAATSSTQQNYNETVTLGTFIEETIGLNDRLFVTGAVRADGASTFGNNYDAAVYPKASLSWLVSDEPFMPRIPGVDEVRLRYAFGMSGQQPDPDWGRVNFRAVQSATGGGVQTVIDIPSLGNPNIKPERVKEHEVGADVNALDNRLHLGVTWYKRDTRDQISSLALPPGLGNVYTNLGLTTQHGFELELSANALNTRSVGVDVALQHSIRRTNLVDLGGAQENRYWGGWAKGYPLESWFQRQIVGFNDDNGDGMLGSGEIHYTDDFRFIGEREPPVVQTLSTVVSLLNRRLRVSALVERKTGFLQANAIVREYCGSRCREGVDPAATFAEQAYARARYETEVYEKGDFTRLRELAASFDLPASMLHALRVRSATLSVAGRNLGLWTDFTGPDPESAQFYSVGGISEAAVPQSPSWSVRLDLGF